jgi:hypothetical protein
MFRCYIANPGCWGAIVKDMRENSHPMMDKAASLYSNEDLAYLKARVRDKYAKLSSGQKKTIEDSEIRYSNDLYNKNVF